VLTEDVTVIAYVDYAKTVADVNNPNSPSYLNLTDPSLTEDPLYANLSTAGQCSNDTLGWSTAWAFGNTATLALGTDDISSDQERRYANFFITAGTANTNPLILISKAPPAQIDTGVLFNNQQYYRIYNRFEAAYQLSGPGGSIQSPIQPLHFTTNPGLTLEPCSGLQNQLFSPVGELHTGYDGTFAVTTNGNLVYRLNEGRVGPLGQAGNAYVNKRPNFGSSLAPLYANYTQATPYVWSVIQFDRTGKLQPLVAGSDSDLPQSTNNDVSVYSTFVIYKGGQQTGAIVLQGDVESFISLDFRYRYLAGC
jgi:hypothetical protein